MNLRCLAVEAFWLLWCLAPAAVCGAASLNINVAQPGVRVSPLLYGIFFEEINHAGQGGIYAELVRNGSLADAADRPAGWSLVSEDGASGRMALDAATPLNDQTPHSLRLEVDKAGPGRVGVANGGFWGINVEQAKTYSLSLWARCSEGFTGPLTAALEHPAGPKYAEAALGALTPRWQRLQVTLTSGATDPAARLVISTPSPGTVWLAAVSLFPPTFMDRPNGLRPDLAGMLRDMRPAFVRFPGGCFVEGNRIANAFRWKTTLGDLTQRPGHWNLWGYHSSDGLGYHEYLQMAEDIGATPLFVINCGMAHEDVVPLDKMGEFVQDALDALEYANGPVDSKWGSLRAKAGHPQPFGLKYLEIGNENGGPPYEERYTMFWRALKTRYPEVQLVANVPVRMAPMDILDEHYYSSPEWFASQAKRYDTYKRDGPKVYVGEYACTQACGQGNLRAALGEAAFMTGMERNSDVVVMASYAPLFVNVNNRAWNPDAIVFDSSRCFGTASYYAQKLFAENRPDQVLPLHLEGGKGDFHPTGAIGLSTWNTQAEFKEIKVSRGDQVLYASDFTTEAKGWRVGKGDWKVQGGAYRQMSLDTDLRTVAGDPNWGDYTLSLKARKLGGSEGFLIMFHVRDDDNWLWWNIGGWGNQRHAIEKCAGGKSELSGSVPGGVETGKWYDIKVELAGARIRCYLDGKLIHDAEDTGPAPLSAVAGRVDQTGEIVVKVVNFTGQPQPTDITLEGVANLQPEGTATILTADDPEAENSFSQPTRVAPVTVPVRGVAPQFSYTFLPWSVTVLRLRG